MGLLGRWAAFSGRGQSDITQMRQIRLVGERYLSNTVSTLDVLDKGESLILWNIKRERQS